VPVLVAYGVPPNHIELFSATGRDLHREWKFDPKTFSGRTRQNFEWKLRSALSRFLASEVPSIGHADYRFVPDIATLNRLLQTRRYDHVIYYGHAVDDGATLKPLHKITVLQLELALKGSGVTHIDILGCRSTAIAARLAMDLPLLTIGNLRGRRFDDVEVDLRTMRLKTLSIVPQPVFHFGPKPAAK